jgi:hypothetical protein
MQEIWQAGGNGRMNGTDGQDQETDWMRTREAHGLPATQTADWNEWYGGLTQEDLEILAAILKP